MFKNMKAWSEFLVCLRCCDMFFTSTEIQKIFFPHQSVSTVRKYLKKSVEEGTIKKECDPMQPSIFYYHNTAHPVWSGCEEERDSAYNFFSRVYTKENLLFLVEAGFKAMTIVSHFNLNNQQPVLIFIASHPTTQEYYLFIETNDHYDFDLSDEELHYFYEVLYAPTALFKDTVEAGLITQLFLLRPQLELEKGVNPQANGIYTLNLKRYKHNPTIFLQELSDNLNGTLNIF